MTDQTSVRFVTVQGQTYLRLEDVVQYLILLASTEETDVRRRLETAAQNLQGNVRPHTY